MEEYEPGCASESKDVKPVSVTKKPSLFWLVFSWAVVVYAGLLGVTDIATHRDIGYFVFDVILGLSAVAIAVVHTKGFKKLRAEQKNYQEFAQGPQKSGPVETQQEIDKAQYRD